MEGLLRVEYEELTAERDKKPATLPDKPDKKQLLPG
jgi:hypothetical protein